MTVENISEIKEKAAKFAIDLIEPGMVVGLGTGSTAQYAIKEIAERINKNELTDLILIPSSLRTEKYATGLGMKLSNFDNVLEIDINIDGADEVDKNTNLIKGGGGALLKEKIIAQNCKRNVIVVSEIKLSNNLGEKWHLPVEILPFAWHLETIYIGSLGAEVELRKNIDGEIFETDQGNYILDCNFGAISDPEKLSMKLGKRAGIIEHGLFINTTDDLVVGKSDSVEHKKIVK
ncbi:MAG: ribose-5-phosphate isomerase RpiA [Thermodesulfobacteriota bacterium]